MIPIVTFCNSNYIKIANNWLKAIRRIGLDKQVLIVALDEKTQESFSNEHILYRPYNNTNHLGSLWLHRTEVLREILLKEGELIHSDSDAIWLQDPLKDIQECGADGVFSQGTIWPPDVHRQFGIVLCCGLFYLSNQKGIQALLDETILQIKVGNDDQAALNRIIAKSIGSWNVKQPYEISFKDTHFIASKMPIISNGLHINHKKIKISILPHHLFPRLVTRNNKDAKIVHPLAGKTLLEKEVCLRNLDLWLS